MCGYKYYKNEMTVYMHMYGIVIMNNLKKLVRLRKEREALGIESDYYRSNRSKRSNKSHGGE